MERGEDVESAALREVGEETGVQARTIAPLGRSEYWFSDGGERVFKVVAFFLVGYARGRLGDLPAESRHEVAEVRWLPLAEAARLLAYRGEREVAARAVELLSAGEDV